EAPPLDPIQGKIHFAPVNKPKFMGSGRFVRMWHGVFWAALGRFMGDIIIDLPVEGHDPFDRAHGELWPPQQTPNPEPPSIWMPLLEVIDLQHERQPDFAGRSLGGEALVHQPREVLRLK